MEGAGVSVIAPDPRPVATAGHRPVDVSARAATVSDAVVIAGLVVWTVAIAAATWGTWGDLTMDTGYDLLAGARTAGGELPYADYTYFYGPLAPLLLGGIYAVTGVAIWPAAALGLVLSALAIGLTYRLARLFVSPLSSGLAAAIVAPATLSSANNSYVLPHTFSAPLAIVLALGALIVLARWARDGGGRGLLVAGGALCGAVAITRPEIAFSLYVGVVGWHAVLLWQSCHGRREALRDAGAFLAPALAIPLVVYGAFLAVVPLSELLWDNLYPRDYIDAAGSVVLKLHAPLTASSFAELAVHAIAYGAGIAALVAAGAAMATRGRARTVALVAAGGGALLFLAVLAVKPDTVRFHLLEWAWAWVPLGAWVAVGALAWRGRDPISRAVLLPVFVLAIVATTTYADFLPIPNALHPNTIPYVLPLAAVFLAWLHGRVLARSPGAAALGATWLALLALAGGVLVVKDARAETETVRGAHGTMTARPAEAAALQQALTTIERVTRPGEPVLLAPQMTALYVMADRRDPLPQLSLLPGALATRADEDRAIARMRNVRAVVVDRTPLTSYGHGPFGTTFDTRLAAWLKRDFRRASTVSGTGADPRTLDVWIRSAP
jgi:hypothetical protein